MKTTPDGFIIESLKRDEKKQYAEGSFLSHILRLAERQVQYFYVRDRSELQVGLDLFAIIGFRYLHTSCHANRKGIALTRDKLDIDDMGKLLSPYLKNRRIFFSACTLVTPELARALLSKTGCYSVIGPSKKIRFDEAALFWASLYHLMFKNDAIVMKRGDLQRNLRALSAVFGVNIRYFAASQKLKSGFLEVPLRA
jgi:hypothetical protein